MNIAPIECAICHEKLKIEDYTWYDIKPALADIEGNIVAMGHSSCVQKQEVEINKAINGQPKEA